MDQIKDAQGRMLTLRKLNALDQVRMLRAIGAEQSQNQPYVHLVECAFMVSDIDGAPVPAPTNERQIDALIGRLGDDGIAAVMVERIKDVRATMDAADAAQDGEVKPSDPLAQSA